MSARRSHPIEAAAFEDSRPGICLSVIFGGVVCALLAVHAAAAVLTL